MKNNDKFRRQGQEFWAYVRLIGDLRGYSWSKKSKNNSGIKVFSKKEIIDELVPCGILITDTMASLLEEYFHYRKHVIEEFAEPNLMDIDESKKRYNALYKLFMNRFKIARFIIKLAN